MKNFGKIIYASSLNCSDILHCSNFIGHSPFIYFEVKNKKFIILPPMELSRAKSAEDKGISVLNMNDLLSEDQTKSAENLLFSVFKSYSETEWCLHSEFPLGLFSSISDRVKKEHLDVSFSKTTFCLLDNRRNKNKEEVTKITHSLRIAEKAMKRAETILKDAKINKNKDLIYNSKKLTSEFLLQEINTELLKNGATGSGTIASSGKDSAIPHHNGEGVIKAHTPIVIDIFPRFDKNGYWGDITRTFCKGKAPEVVKKTYDAVLGAKNEAIKSIKIGKKYSDIHNIAAKTLEKYGFKTGIRNGAAFGFCHGLGHGVGLDIHELPRVNQTSDSSVQIGDLFTIEPGLYYHEWGGIRLEDMVSIDKDGAVENITKYKTILEIK